MVWVCKYCSTDNSDENVVCSVCGKSKNYCRVSTLTASRVKKLGLSGDVVIPAEYKIIGKGAFFNRSDITSVTLHENVTKICEQAFKGCAYLERVTVLGKLSVIGADAFADCVSLAVINRPCADKVAENAFGFSPELAELDDLLGKLDTYLRRYKRVMSIQKDSRLDYSEASSRIDEVTALKEEIDKYKISAALGESDESKRRILYGSTVYQCQCVTRLEENLERAERAERGKQYDNYDDGAKKLLAKVIYGILVCTIAFIVACFIIGKV